MADFEYAEVSNAKDHVMEAVRDELEVQGFDLEDFDLIAVADRVIETLLNVGVTVPDTLTSPYDL